MKKYASLISFLIIIIAACWGFYDQKPIVVKKAKTPTEFSLDSALVHLKNITKELHHVGTKGHKNAQNYLIQQLHRMGLSPSIQTQTVVNKKWYAGTTAENILARIKGKESGKALLLLSHYDSNPNLGMGASDAGSGVVTILEGIRAFLAKGEQPKNDIITLISDAEELGLLGAYAFVEHHPWAKEIGLVLNFEARGSGGPSYMLMETNGKNSKLISEFINAKPNYPVSNSLLYSIYKKLPNDTDLTVFRENGNINGFNFAFIGDHFDYHTVQDTYERIDRTSLAHQGDYLMSMLNYFAFSDIQNLNSDIDYVYVNFPFFQIISYPFSWVNIMLTIATLALIILILFGILLNRIQLKDLFIGFIPSILSVLLCGGLTFLLWKLILVIAPEYKDMLHGFTYNGYWFIISFVCFNIWMAFSIYKKFIKKENINSLFVAPIVLWLIINFMIPQDFKGAGFFILPVFVAEIILIFSVFIKPKNKTYVVLFALLSIPTVYIFAPMIKLFPVGLGLKNLFISGILVSLVFGLLIPAINASKSRKAFTRLTGLLTVIFFIVTYFQSGFDTDNKKPNSLVYIKNSTDSTSHWGTYNRILDPYILQKLGNNPIEGGIASARLKSKYNTRFSYHAPAENIPIPSAEVQIQKDTIIEELRILDFNITPKRQVRKIELISKDSLEFKKLLVNGAKVNNGLPYLVRRGSFLIYHFGNQDSILRLQMTLEKNITPNIIINEISDDLLENPLLSLRPREQYMMPMPFVTNNAIICTQEIKL